MAENNTEEKITLNPNEGENLNSSQKPSPSPSPDLSAGDMDGGGDELGGLNFDLDDDAIKNIDKENIKNALINFIVPLVALGIIIVLLVAVIIPTYNSLPELRQELEEKQSKQAVLETKKGVLNRLIDFENVVAEDTELFSQALVAEPMVPELLTQIDAIARESGLTVIKLSNSLTETPRTTGSAAEEETVDYKTVTVTLGVTGSYDQLVLFNQNLERSTRLVQVVDFRFSAEDGEGLGDYTATFVLESPYLPIQTEAVTDEPITVDVSNPEFLKVVETIRSMKHYDITVQDYILENIEQQEQEEAEAEEETTDEGDEETAEEDTTEETPETSPEDETTDETNETQTEEEATN